MNRSFRYRIYPTRAQEQRFDETLGLCRELYNAALQERRDAWKMNRVRVSRFEQSRQVTEVKELRPELRLIPSCVLQRLDKSFQAFFRRVKAHQVPGSMKR